VRAEIEAGIEFAKASPSPDASDLEKFVYTEPA
jgi:TPP-dependent pyruvate/acetoin dehydrogenase alpha subunit